MSAKRPHQDFFVGYAARQSAPTRRFLVAAALGLVGAAAAAGGALGARNAAQGPGGWNQGDVREWIGMLGHSPYAHLRMVRPNGAVRTALLATYGKSGVRDLIGDTPDGMAAVRGSPIARGDNLMLAVDGQPGWLRGATAPALPPVMETDLGEAAIAGEILDAKCWFGAMKPGFGKTHKACAALCARGGLPLAFCASSACGDGVEAPLFLDALGRPHDARILPFVADPVLAMGRLVRVDDLVQFRVALSGLRRL